MKTNEKGFFHWFTNSGNLDKNLLSVDAAQILNFYKENGYIDAQISEPTIEHKENYIFVIIKIQEGDRFTFGNINITSDNEKEKETLLLEIKSIKGKYYNHNTVQKDINLINIFYANKGYANADTIPIIKRNVTNKTININYTTEKKNLVYFGKIFIEGNKKTRDKVIRRELHIEEQGLYSSEKLKRSMKNLKRLEYFKDVNISMLPNDDIDRKDLKIIVEDKPTGLFTIGGGYSSENDVYFKTTLGQRNLFGKGQILNFSAELGETFDSFSINFTEPYLFDIPLTAGFSIFNIEKEYTDYNKESKGGTLKLGYRFFDYTNTLLVYRYELADINGITRVVGDPIYDYEGENTTSSITFVHKYDSRDRTFNAKEGSTYRFSTEYAGGFLGGNIEFTKYILDGGYYQPLFWKFVGFVHGRFGYIKEKSDSKLDYERFHLGGMSSVRGFDSKDITIYKDDEKNFRIGGDKMALFNAELLFPISEEANFMGLFFYDAGDVYDNDESYFERNLNTSYGFGFRWFSPMGPLRLEYGMISNSNDKDLNGGRWDFTMGVMF